MARIPKYLIIFSLLVIIGVIGAGVFYLHSRIDFDDLSIQQLTSGGYYAYIIPDFVADKYGWSRRIRMTSFDWQCGYYEDTWNPVEIFYNNISGTSVFDMTISEQDALFDERKVTQTVTVNADWVPTHTGTAYTPSERGGTELKVHDTFGSEVVFASWMKLDDLLAIISKLEYVGPDAKTVGDPWKKACGQ